MPQFLPALLLGWLISLTPAAVQAQAGTTVAFGSLKGDPTQPVEVTSDQAQFNQTNGTAMFSGSVIVIQGAMRLTAPEVQVDYAADGKRIARVHATGGVTLANGGEAAEAQDAVYTIDTGQVVMTGEVLLTQGTSALSGKVLTVDLATGTGVMEGRVQMVFVPGTAAP
jgi:lipopolysaccharide export system protein LptA